MNIIKKAFCFINCCFFLANKPATVVDISHLGCRLLVVLMQQEKLCQISVKHMRDEESSVCVCVSACVCVCVCMRSSVHLSIWAPMSILGLADIPVCVHGPVRSLTKARWGDAACGACRASPQVSRYPQMWTTALGCTAGFKRDNKSLNISVKRWRILVPMRRFFKLFSWASKHLKRGACFESDFQVWALSVCGKSPSSYFVSLATFE